jgi:hypothetical protein
VLAGPLGSTISHSTAAAGYSSGHSFVGDFTASRIRDS